MKIICVVALIACAAAGIRSARAGRGVELKTWVISGAAGSQEGEGAVSLRTFGTAAQGITVGARHGSEAPAELVLDGIWDRLPGEAVRVTAIGMLGLGLLLAAGIVVLLPNRRRGRRLAASFAVLSLCASVGDAKAAEGFLTYQGHVLVDGAAHAGLGYFKFALVESDGTALWTHDGELPEPVSGFPLELVDGYVLAYLGQAPMAAMDPAAFEGKDLRLRIWFAATRQQSELGQFTQLVPDLRFGDVPRAFESVIAGEARTSRKLEGLAAADFARAQHTHSADDISSGALADGRIPAAIARDAEILPVVLGGDGAGSGLDSDLLDGQDATFYRDAANLSAGTLQDARLSANVGLLGGRAGGQKVFGGTGAGDKLTLESTSNPSRGDIILSPTTGNVGIGTTAPEVKLDVHGPIRSDASLLAPVIGTLLNQALTVVVGATPALRLVPGATSDTGPTLIGGFKDNITPSAVNGAVIAGGGQLAQPNRVFDHFGVVGGGLSNSSGSNDATLTNSQHATVGGGVSNTASGQDSTVGGGNGNAATGQSSLVGGGRTNEASGTNSSVGGGVTNKALGAGSTVSGGTANLAAVALATVAGGTTNNASGTTSTISGGRDNVATGASATVSGGNSNDAAGLNSTIGGGLDNRAADTNATVSGGESNDAAGSNSTIGGGLDNVTVGPDTTVAGGNSNGASGAQSTVGGGTHNSTSGPSSTIAGGSNNAAQATRATVGGGEGNFATGAFATVPGGFQGSAPLFGQMAHASGQFSGKGDAQSSTYILRRFTTTNIPAELFLDGAGERLTVASGRRMAFHILLVAASINNHSAAYEASGMVANINGTLSFVSALAPNFATLAESNPNWGASLTIDTTNDALVIGVLGTTGDTIRWVAEVRTAEVAF